MAKGLLDGLGRVARFGFVLFGLANLIRHPFAEVAAARALVALLQQQHARGRILNRNSVAIENREIDACVAPNVGDNRGVWLRAVIFWPVPNNATDCGLNHSGAFLNCFKNPAGGREPRRWGSPGAFLPADGVDLATEAEAIPAAVLVEKVAVAATDHNAALHNNTAINDHCAVAEITNHNTAPANDNAATVSTGRTRCYEQHSNSDERCEIPEHGSPPILGNEF